MAALAVAITVGVGVSVFLVLAGEQTVEASGESRAVARQKIVEARNAERERSREKWEKRKQERAARWKKQEDDSERRRAALEEEMKKPQKKRVRRVRRWAWMSTSEKIARSWNVPRREMRHASITGLLRICTSEQEGSEEDCIGIHQVLRNIRNRSCNRDYIRLITECDEEGETLLSTMRRASRYVVGAAPARYARQRWIAEMTTECDMPRSYPATVRRHCRRGTLQTCAQELWDSRHRHHCENTTKLATGLIDGTDKRRITNARIIAWGGRCEVPRGACDDPVACARGLARVPHIERMKPRSKGGKRPANAFWCRPYPGSYCGTSVDPLCEQMGFAPSKEVATAEKTVQDG